MTHSCLVLAGGLGTRMARYTTNMPKILIPVAGEPFLHHQLRLLESQGITRILLSLGYLGSMVEKELQTRSYPGLDIDVFYDGDSALGTGGATRKAAQHHLLDDNFFVTYGDSYLLIDPAAMVHDYKPRDFEAIMALYPNDEKLDVSNAQIFPDSSVRYEKNLPDPESLGLNMVDFGISYVSRNSVLRRIPAETNFDLADYFHEISEMQKLQGFVVSQRFYEIGSPGGRDDLEIFLTTRKAHHDNF
jgi:N-acetyl-alpha-D-muramate 1-phosphate uridylyltransferase